MKLIVYLQLDNANLLFLHLESLRELFVFHNLNQFLNALIFKTLCGSILVSSKLNAIVAAY